MQALVSVLDALTQDHDWTAIQLEPDVISDKVDILWEYPSRRKVVQVKSSQNQISVPDVRTWAEALEQSITADEYEICLIGPVSHGVPGMGSHGKVQIPTPRPLDPDGLVHQTAHQLDRYLQSLQLGIQSPTTREMVVNALVTRLSTFATTGTPVKREVFNGQLLSWIGRVAEVGITRTQSQYESAREYQPKAEDVEVMRRLDAAHQNLLLLVKTDSVAGFVVIIDGQPLADVYDPDACIKYIEAVHRLRRHGLLINPRRDGQTFNLSSEGRELVRRLERTCLSCGKTKLNIGPDPNQPPVWVCKNHRCLDSWWHEHSKCPKCGKRPYEITSQGVGFTAFLCEDGHQFTEQPRRG